MSVKTKGAIRELPCFKISGLDRFSVSKIFDCGQCFRFNLVENSKHEAEYSGVAFGRFVSFAQDGDTLYIYNATKEDYEKVWKHFLSLDVDYAEIENNILSRSANVGLKNAVEFSRGIRILRQMKWEAVCSFIISQNNNIPRIKKIIESLAKRCGNKIELPEGAQGHLSPYCEYYSFPEPNAILDIGIEGLFELRTGFRAKYIYDAACLIDSEIINIELIDTLSTDDAIKYLCEVKGIGPKVASCALLFGFEKYDAFPIDVWIKKVISKYFDCENPDKFDSKSLGEYAGIAQQFLFYYERYGGYKSFN